MYEIQKKKILCKIKFDYATFPVNKSKLHRDYFNSLLDISVQWKYLYQGE